MVASCQNMAIDKSSLIKWFAIEGWPTEHLDGEDNQLNESAILPILLEHSTSSREQGNHPKALEIIDKAQALGLESPWLEFDRSSTFIKQNNHQARQILKKLSKLEKHPKLMSLAQKGLEDLSMGIDKSSLIEWFEAEGWQTENLTGEDDQLNESAIISIILDKSTSSREQGDFSRALEIIDKAQVFGLESPWLEHDRASTFIKQNNQEARKILQNLALLENHPKLSALAHEDLKSLSLEDETKSESSGITIKTFELINTLHHLSATHNWGVQHLPSPEQQLENIELERLIIEECNDARNNNLPQLSLEIASEAISAGIENPWLLDCKARALSTLEEFDEAHHIWSQLSNLSDRPALASAVKISLQESTQRKQAIDLSPSKLLRELHTLAKQEQWDVQHLPGTEQSIKDADLISPVIKESQELLKNNKPKLSLEVIDHALRNKLSSPWLDLNKAKALMFLNSFEEAETILQHLSAQTDKPKLSQASKETLCNCMRKHSIHIATLLKNEGKFSQAIELLNRNQITCGMNEEVDAAIKKIILEEEEKKEAQNPFFETQELRDHYVQLRATETFIDLIESLDSQKTTQG